MLDPTWVVHFAAGEQAGHYDRESAELHGWRGWEFIKERDDEVFSAVAMQPSLPKSSCGL